MVRLHKCDVCGTEYENYAPLLDFDPDGRAPSGRMLYRDGVSVEWPLRTERVDLCSECCQVVAEALQERMTD